MKANNNQKMREALEDSTELLQNLGVLLRDDLTSKQICANNDALSAPARNCDIGTAEEQVSRWMRFCTPKSCSKCPVYQKSDGVNCHFVWLQMPYEGGDK